MNNKPLLERNIVIVGHGRHGKDTVAEILRDKIGLPFQSSSEACSELFIFDTLRDKYGYKTSAECYSDRHNHRKEWFNLICEFNSEDPTKLGRAMFKRNRIYVGIRNRNELLALRNAGLVDHVVWVDASDRLPPESNESMTITPFDADHIIDNNNMESVLPKQVISWLWKII
jgi:hypothetical protein